MAILLRDAYVIYHLSIRGSHISACNSVILQINYCALRIHLNQFTQMYGAHRTVIESK